MRIAIYTLHVALFDGEVKIFKRALISGHMYHSETYTKVTQRNSYTVQFSNRNMEKFFIMLCWIDHLMFFLCPFKELATSFCKDDLTGKLGKHLTVVNTDRSEPIIVPLNEIKQVIIMKTTGLAGCVVTWFPNFIERD